MADLIIHEGNRCFRATLHKIHGPHGKWQILLNIEKPKTLDPRWGSLFQRHTGEIMVFELNENCQISKDLLREASKLFP